MTKSLESNALAPSTAAVWSLFLPPAERIVCHALGVPDVARELASRGAHVDLVSRCALEAWNENPLSGSSRCLWEPDPDTDYDLALAWDPPSSQAVRQWIAMSVNHPAPPREVAVWSRNPLHATGVPPWWRIDRGLERRGFVCSDAQVGLPAADRIKQVVEWDAWMRTPLVRHRRTHKAWKEWMTRTAVGRWVQPVRLRRAHLAPVTGAPSRLQSILASAAAAVAAPVALERLLVSTNGVAIAIVEVAREQEPRRAVLKIPYARVAEPRVARNAAALEWVAGEPAIAGIAPRLCARGQVDGFPWTMEEWLPGTEAQHFDPASRDRVFEFFGRVLGAFAAAATSPRALDEATFERACAAPLRAAAMLLPSDAAQRLHALRDHLQAALDGVPIPLGARHGDLKLENVIGESDAPDSWRLLDWELFAARGLPLLDALHVVVSRRARDAGCSLGAAVRRWALPRDFDATEQAFLSRASAGLDPRFVAVAPILYWLDRIGPIAARGAWPDASWARANVLAVLDELPVSRRVEVSVR